MNHRCAALGLSLIGVCCLAAAPVEASDRNRTPLQLGLVAAAGPVAREHARSRLLPPAPVRGQRYFAQARDEAPLRQRALQSVLTGSELAANEASSVSDRPEDRFRFEKTGNAARDFSRGYRDMCAKASNRIWDEPNGRRIKFDIAGKPGVAIEIPLR